MQAMGRPIDHSARDAETIVLSRQTFTHDPARSHFGLERADDTRRRSDPGRETPSRGIPLEVYLAPSRRAVRRAAEGQEDVAEVSTPLLIVLQLEGVTCQ
jgi:hypothetical protein